MRRSLLSEVLLAARIKSLTRAYSFGDTALKAINKKPGIAGLFIALDLLSKPRTGFYIMWFCAARRFQERVGPTLVYPLILPRRVLESLFLDGLLP
jgi:hypothetical protein